MNKYEVIGIGIDAKGLITDYFKTYAEFEKPADAIFFAHGIGPNWLLEFGELPENVCAVDVIVDLVDEDGVQQNETPCWSDRIAIYCKTNFGLQPQAKVV